MAITSEVTVPVPPVEEGFAPSGEYFSPASGGIPEADVVSLEAGCIPEVVATIPGHEHDEVHLERQNGWQLPKLGLGSCAVPTAVYLAEARGKDTQTLVAESAAKMEEKGARPDITVQVLPKHDRNIVLAGVLATREARKKPEYRQMLTDLGKQRMEARLRQQQAEQQ